MAGPETENRIDLGLYARPQAKGGPGNFEVIAIALTVLWLAASGVFFMVFARAAPGFDALRFIITALAIFMPVALIWVAATAAPWGSRR